ncbi:MAG: hypothetical protein M2R45_02429 [Verrucomicrobia subdivision 3 bacterium]|nr:hypothetical protein [Limisphaerales bacterium]MCS1416366.1 hypothetical protein [Limisphaerales bacterium]
MPRGRGILIFFAGLDNQFPSPAHLPRNGPVMKAGAKAALIRNEIAAFLAPQVRRNCLGGLLVLEPSFAAATAAPKSAFKSAFAAHKIFWILFARGRCLRWRWQKEQHGRGVFFGMGSRRVKMREQ